MKLCLVRCTVLDMECQAFGFVMREMGIKSPGKQVIGISYDDYTFGFYSNKENAIKDDECK